jgi:putative membrane protein
MGAADIVPGVSGGTIAFITGIYQRLIAAITAFDIALARQVFRGDLAGAWSRVDGPFLLALVLGIGTSVFALAGVIGHVLETRPLVPWSFFFGLILSSAAVLLRHVQAWSAAALAGVLTGAAVAALIGLSPAFAFPGGLFSFFLAGFIAICAMILPGISGSFILVLFGMYPRVLAAVRELDAVPLLLFAAGAASGLLVFTRVLKFVLERYHGPTLATLTGFLLGSLPVVWPWKLNALDEVPARPVSPAQYAEALGDAHVLMSLALMALGFLLVWLLERRWGGLER